MSNVNLNGKGSDVLMGRLEYMSLAHRKKEFFAVHSSAYVPPPRMRPVCKICGCKIRGRNHDEGRYHKMRVKAKVH